MNNVSNMALPAHFVVVDVETRYSAQEVGGWEHPERMGVSVAVVFDSRTHGFTWYEQDGLSLLARHLASAQAVVGFNTLKFDYAVLQPHIKETVLSHLPSIDLLVHLHAALGFRVSLDSVAMATLHTTKSASGLDALSWWKQGKIDQIGQYCQQDVALTRDIYMHGKRHGVVQYTKKDGSAASVPALW